MEDFFIELSSSFYNQLDPRRRPEREDARMIQEDHKAMSNLPTRGFQHQFDPQHKRRYFKD